MVTTAPPRPSAGSSATVQRLLGFNSVVYSLTNLLLRGAGFLLLPIYTRYLTPGDYGTLAVVTAVTGFLNVVFTFALPGAMTRFYFEYRDDPAALREFWGTVLTLVALTSIAGCVVLLAFGEVLLAPFIGAVRFWPEVALGIVTLLFQPFVTTYLGILQTRNQALRYAAFAVCNFAVTVALTVSLVVFAGWGAPGPLTATLITAAAFTMVALIALRRDVRISFNTKYVRQAIAYCLPQVPHMLGAQVTAAADRLLLNRLAGMPAVGLYNIGATLGMGVDLVAYSVNRAFAPIAMDLLSNRNPARLETLRELGLTAIAWVTLLAAALALAAREVTSLLTAPAFEAAWSVVPLVAFAGAVGGAYYVLVNILFFDVRATRYLPAGMATSAVVSVSVNLLLIPRLGLMGAAVSALCTQCVTTVVIAAIARRFDPVRWPYGRLALALAACMAIVLPFAYLDIGSTWLSLVARLAAFAAASLVLGACLWGEPLRPWRSVRSLLAASGGR